MSLENFFKPAALLAGVAVAVAVAVAVTVALALMLPVQQANATPAFAKKTGESCGFCHTRDSILSGDYILNRQGREFKSNDYRLGSRDEDSRPARRPSSREFSGRCPRGQMTCAQLCDRDSPNPRNCKFARRDSCMSRFGSIDHCVGRGADNEGREGRSRSRRGTFRFQFGGDGRDD